MREIEWMNEREGTKERWYEASFTIIHFYPLIRKTHNFIFAVNTSIFLAVVCSRMEDVQRTTTTTTTKSQIHGTRSSSNEHPNTQQKINAQQTVQALKQLRKSSSFIVLLNGYWLPLFRWVGWLLTFLTLLFVFFFVLSLFLFFIGLKTLSIRQVLNKYIETMKINFCDLWKILLQEKEIVRCEVRVSLGLMQSVHTYQMAMPFIWNTWRKARMHCLHKM